MTLPVSDTLATTTLYCNCTSEINREKVTLQYDVTAGYLSSFSKYNCTIMAFEIWIVELENCSGIYNMILCSLFSWKQNCVFMYLEREMGKYIIDCLRLQLISLSITCTEIPYSIVLET